MPEKLHQLVTDLVKCNQAADGVMLNKTPAGKAGVFFCEGPKSLYAPAIKTPPGNHGSYPWSCKDTVTDSDLPEFVECLVAQANSVSCHAQPKLKMPKVSNLYLAGSPGLTGAFAKEYSGVLYMWQYIAGVFTHFKPHVEEYGLMAVNLLTWPNQDQTSMNVASVVWLVCAASEFGKVVG
jgi:hypothetical protein